MRLAIHLRAFALAILSVFLLTVTASAAEVRVMISGGLAAAYKALVPEFERATGHKVLTAYGPSMGTTASAIPVRLERGEPADVLIMVGYALDDLAKKGKVDRRQQGRSRQITDRGRREIGHAKAGHLYARCAQARPAGGEDRRLFGQRQRRLCLDRDVRQARHCRRNEGQGEEDSATPVGEIVARGDAEIGFQQMSELKPVEGIDIIGPLPDELQKITIFSAGIASASKEPDAGKALIKFLASPAARGEIVKSGMDPIPAGSTN